VVNTFCEPFTLPADTSCYTYGSETVGPFAAGTGIAFYYAPNGNMQSANTYYSNGDMKNPDHVRHAIGAVTDGNLAIGFEAENADDCLRIPSQAYCYSFASLIVVINPSKPVNYGDIPQASDGQYVDPGPTCTASTADITNKVVRHGREYALIDNTLPSSVSIGKQQQRWTTPSGWDIAENQPWHRAAVTTEPWGCAGVVLSDGTALSAGLTTFNTSALTQKTCTNGVGYGIGNGDYRVLITRDATELDFICM